MSDPAELIRGVGGVDHPDRLRESVAALADGVQALAPQTADALRSLLTYDRVLVTDRHDGMPSIRLRGRGVRASETPDGRPCTEQTEATLGVWLSVGGAVECDFRRSSYRFCVTYITE